MGKEENLMRCLILGGGEINDYPAVAGMLDGAEFVVCADSGYGHCKGLDVKPDLLVGDFDSIGEMPPEHIPRIVLSEEKDITDTDFAVQKAIELGYRTLILAGMTGGRPDHTLANLQTLAGLSQKHINVVLTDGVTDYYAVTASKKGGEIRLPPKKNHYFSIFAMGLCRRVNIRGAKYPLIDYDLRFDEARAVSNEFLSGEAVVTLNEGTILVVITPKF